MQDIEPNTTSKVLEKYREVYGAKFSAKEAAGCQDKLFQFFNLLAEIDRGSNQKLKITTAEIHNY